MASKRMGALEYTTIALTYLSNNGEGFHRIAPAPRVDEVYYYIGKVECDTDCSPQVHSPHGGRRVDEERHLHIDLGQPRGERASGVFERPSSNLDVRNQRLEIDRGGDTDLELSGSSCGCGAPPLRYREKDVWRILGVMLPKKLLLFKHA